MPFSAAAWDTIEPDPAQIGSREGDYHAATSAERAPATNLEVIDSIRTSSRHQQYPRIHLKARIDCFAFLSNFHGAAEQSVSVWAGPHSWPE